jgi:hypothetical protein
MVPKAFALPGDDRRGLHKHQDLAPVAPVSGQPRPQDPVRETDRRAPTRSLVHRKLMSECDALKLEANPRAKHTTDEPEQRVHDGHYEVGGPCKRGNIRGGQLAAG